MSFPLDDLASREFSIVRKGYDPVEVRSFLSDLAHELAAGAGPEEPAGEGGALGDARGSADATDLAEANRTIASLSDEAGQLRGDRDELAAMLEQQREAHERELQDQAADALARIEAAETRADKGPFRGAGDTVARVLAAAHDEAAGLVEAAEAMAMKIRDDLKAEVTATRADADRDANQVRADAEAFATQRRTATEADLADATAAVAAQRAEAERIRSEAEAHAAAVTEGAAAQAEAEAERRVVEARAELERIRAVSSEASARLRRVQGLLTKALLAVNEEAGPDIDLTDASPATSAPTSPETVHGTGRHSMD